MKKATLLTFLFAVLMIALLVSCNTTPDPLPDESTSDEVTPEPTDVTSDEAEVSDPVETTTEAVTTKKEYETSISEYGSKYIFMEPIASEYWSEGAPEEPVQIVDTDAPWVITEWETRTVPMSRKERDIPEEKANLAIHVPKSYEVSIDEFISVKVEFFQEYYPIGSYIPVRYTVKNISSSDIHEIRYDRLSSIRNKTLGTATSVHLGLYPLEGNNSVDKNWYVPYHYWQLDMAEFKLKAQSMETFEFVHVAFENLFDAEGESEIVLHIELWGSFSMRVIAEVPLEIVEVEYIDP